MVLLASHPTRLIPKWKGRGGAMHKFHSLCLVYMMEQVSCSLFLHSESTPFPCMGGVRGEVHNIIFSLAVMDRLLVQMYIQFLGYHYSLSWPITNQSQRYIYIDTHSNVTYPSCILYNTRTTLIWKHSYLPTKLTLCIHKPTPSFPTS